MFQSTQPAVSRSRPWESLRAFARPPEPPQQCELCGAQLASEHQHLVEPATRTLLCACDACAVLFEQEGTGRYRRVPREGRFLPHFQLSDLVWSRLSVPIGLAFFYDSQPAGRVVAIYPSPAGPVESLLDLECWHEVVASNPVLQQMRSDVEGLLVNRVKSAPEYYLAPIDTCYQLVGLIRLHWRGLSGGETVWQEMDRFFASLKIRSRGGTLCPS